MIAIYPGKKAQDIFDETKNELERIYKRFNGLDITVRDISSGLNGGHEYVALVRFKGNLKMRVELGQGHVSATWMTITRDWVEYTEHEVDKKISGGMYAGMSYAVKSLINSGETLQKGETRISMLTADGPAFFNGEDWTLKLSE